MNNLIMLTSYQEGHIIVNTSFIYCIEEHYENNKFKYSRIYFTDDKPYELVKENCEFIRKILQA